jgi:hypothetical protein
MYLTAGRGGSITYIALRITSCTTFVHDGVVIWSLAPDRHLFIFRFRLDRKSRQVQTCFPIPLPFTCSRWRFSRPFPRALFYCVYVTLPLIRGPRNFASFSPVWPQQPYWMVSLIVVVYFNFCSFVRAVLWQNLIVCFRLLSSEAIDLYCSWLIVFLLWIQFSAAIAAELAGKTCVRVFYPTTLYNYTHKN